MAKLILAALLAINLTNTMAKLNNPDNPKHTFIGNPPLVGVCT